MDTSSRHFYVDPEKGRDDNPGTIDHPFKSLDKALAVVGARVEQGIRSDHIYLRGGVYRKDSFDTLYWLNLKGTPEAPSLLSAMPAEPGAPGAVQRKSGRWYERVVFDDSWILKGPWRPVPGRPEIWATHPGYVLNNWEVRVTWAWRGIDLPDERPKPGAVIPFTVGPYMLLQDGEPYEWATSLDKIDRPGLRTYDRATDTLYVWPLHGKDPNDCLMETWYGGPEEEGKMLLDGEGRSIFNGHMEYAGIIGCEFRMFLQLFEFRRREMSDPSQRVFQRHVTFADNECRYGWMQILLDSNVVFSQHKETFTRFDDRSHWHVHHNVFFRPSREVFQVHGRDHIFEYNEIIEHGGPWAGPAAIVSSVNLRNTLNAQIRYNYIHGQGNNPWRPGSIFMIEADDGHGDENGDSIFGGQTYIGNIIVNQTAGPAMVLGKGGARMRDITIRDNIFAGHRSGPTILLTSPHKNLRIENNIFYDQYQVVQIQDSPYNSMRYESLPSTISIRNNIFLRNRRTFDPRFFAPHPESRITVKGNVFHDNADGFVAEGSHTFDPKLKDPEKLDFRPADDSPLLAQKERIGVYAGPDDAPHGMDWWRIAEEAPCALIPDRKSERPAG